MIGELGHVSLFVRDYDEAIHWYTGVLGLELKSDQAFGPGQRWVTVSAGRGSEIVLVQAGDDNRDMVGKQSAWVFHTDDCAAEVTRLRDGGVAITSGPDSVPWGIQATFDDLYGNRMVLLQTAGGAS